MSKYDPNDQNLDDLLRQVDSLLDEPQEDSWYGEDAPLDDGIDVDEYTPAETLDDAQPIFYQNHANDYGRQVRNYQNSYGGQRPAPQPEYNYEQAEDEYIEQAYNQPTIPAYNADFHQAKRERNTKSQAHKAQQQRQSRDVVRKKTEYRDYGEPEYPEVPGKSAKRKPQPAPQPKKSPPKRGCCGCGCTTMLVALGLVAALIVGVFLWVFDMPQAETSIGERKRDTAAILICGTDASGDRTDTMMLLYLSGSEHKVGLLSLPRDTYTIATAGYAAKLNSAYGRNNCGEEGMEALLDYIQDIIGYRPDGYMLVDFTLVPQIVDLMGGVDVEVPVTITDDGLNLQPGMQHLGGQEVLTLLRHRSSYAMADLTRVEVQRSVIKACIDQWVSISHLKDVGSALKLIESNSLTSLSTRNYLWIGKTLLLNMSGGFTTETLPGYADYIGDASYYILNRGDVADMINESFNPYQVTIDADNLNIAG